ncbi:SLC13 family permease [Candidatus Nitrospira inopinata]|jgi:di/tricarboxylate transporter|uniref:Putative Transporter n=1 Tax=Candidatus Nitrospira inopinata TaxID=1715989 RepID=A0A0S4KQB8_9BACT|nr:SLC13 family permease [Candidatus Nitrospira inopinata]CUQ65549.1 putative Transporter [Candidatus Nitrospira inopinata]
MSLEMAFVLVVTVVAVVLFVTEKLPVDVVALGIMAVLLLGGILTPEEGLAGFSNPATVTVGAMLVLSAGLFKSGALNVLSVWLGLLGQFGSTVLLMTMMIVVGTVSAFINNTAAVAMLMPVVIGMAPALGVSPSRLLMPLSFASMFGGVCTLIGTSTNIVVSSISERYGQPGFAMFETTPLGLVFFAAGTAYMLAAGLRLIPDRRADGDLTRHFSMDEYLTEIVLLPEAKSVGTTVGDCPLVKDIDLDILEVRRGAGRALSPDPSMVLQAGDVLLVRCNVAQIRQLQERVGIALKPEMQWRDQDLESGGSQLIEAVVAPYSVLDGRSLKGIRFRDNFGATVLAIRHHGKVVHENLNSRILRSGDVLLLNVRRDSLTRLRESPAFVMISDVELPTFRTHKLVTALVIVAGVVGAAALHLVPIVVSAVAGCVLLVLTGCLTMQEAYGAVEWRIIVLLAGVLTLGIALEKTGAALLLSKWLIATVGIWGPVALVSALYLATSLLTEAMSNNATAALLAPIAIAAAQSMNLNPRPFLMAITFAASASFMTPVGYQTNTLIYGPGRYTFADFVRVGTPLNILFWILATLLIPVFWPFQPA